VRVQIRTGRMALVEPRQQPFDAAGAPLCLVCMHRAPLPATDPDPHQVSTRVSLAAAKVNRVLWDTRVLTCGVWERRQPLAFADLFCAGRKCLEQYTLRTSTAGLRKALFKWERGVCQTCGVDMHALCERIKVLPREKRAAVVVAAAPAFAVRGNGKALQRLVESAAEGCAWHADHKLAVRDGGGECGLDNLTTLCVLCHQQARSPTERRCRSARGCVWWRGAVRGT
jgi:5-methylcytosine-specific restriction endonuclease McrA